MEELSKIIISLLLTGWIAWNGISIRVGAMRFYILPLKRFFKKKNK